MKGILSLANALNVLFKYNPNTGDTNDFSNLLDDADRNLSRLEALRRMFKDKKWFMEKLEELIIINQTGEEDKLHTTEMGLAHITSEVHRKIVTCDFECFICVWFKKNLISVFQIDMKGGLVLFGNCCVFVYYNDEFTIFSLINLGPEFLINSIF